MMPAFTNDELELLRQVAELPGPNRLHELDDAYLCQLSRIKGVDFATALLYQGIRASSDHGPFVGRIEVLFDAQSPPSRIDAAFVVAPGAFYREHPETGADGTSLCRMAAAVGCRTDVIPTHSMGTAADNGRIIRDWLLGTSERNVILCSLSKGGADVKVALADSTAPQAFRNVVAWLNVGGTTSGSPIASWVLARRWLALAYRALFWCRGQDFGFVRELQRGAGSPLDFCPTVPSHMRVVHVVGFPLSRHIRHRRTRYWHRRLSRYGPNDGATILVDSLCLPGLVLPVWGADHYLDSVVGPDVLLVALLRYLAEELHLYARSHQPSVLAESSAAK